MFLLLVHERQCQSASFPFCDELTLLISTLSSPSFPFIKVEVVINYSSCMFSLLLLGICVLCWPTATHYGFSCSICFCLCGPFDCCSSSGRPWSAAHLQATLVLSWLSSPVSCFPLHCLDRRLRLIVRVRVLPLFLEPYPLRVEASLPPAGKPPFWACWAVMWVDFWVS